jgi:hypothetical protein
MIRALWPASHVLRQRRRRRAAHPVRRLRARRQPQCRTGTGAGVDAEPDRREDSVGERLPRHAGALGAGPDLGRERPGRADVQPRRHRACGVVRPTGVRRPGQGPTPTRGAPTARARAEPGRKEAGRARWAPQACRRASPIRRRARELSEVEAVAEGVSRQIDAYRQGKRLDPRAHIRKAAVPTVTPEMRFGRASELWAALSLSALLVGLVALVLAGPDHLLAWIIVFVINERIRELRA